MDQNVCGPISKVERKTTLELNHFIVLNGLVYTDSLDKANVLNRRFSSVFTTEDTSYLPTVHEHNIPAMNSIIINSPGVTKLL